MYMSARRFAREVGISYSEVIRLCNSDIGGRFAQPSKCNSEGRCIGTWRINPDAFCKLQESGAFRRYGEESRYL